MDRTDWILTTALLFAGCGVGWAQTGTQDQPWRLLQPSGTKVKFEMPTEPVRQRLFPAGKDRPEISVVVYNSTTADRKISVVCSYHEVQTRLDSNAIRRQTLAKAAQSTLIRMQGTPLRNEIRRFKRGLLGCELIYLGSNQQSVHKVSTRLILVGNRLYNLSVVAQQDDFDQKLTDRYFDSFQIVDENYDLPPRPRRR